MLNHELDAQLLRVLHELYPNAERFDEFHVSIAAPRSPRLLRALEFLTPAIDRRRRRLVIRSRVAVEQWLEDAKNRDIGAGLYLRRDGFGWSYVERAGAGATGGAP